MFVGALLHDVGALTPEDKTRIHDFDEIDLWPHCARGAAFHHEKLDGSGYPFHVDSEKLEMQSRIMVVADICTALAEDRPYRAGMRRTEIENILTNLVNKNGIDKRIVGLLFDDYGNVLECVKEQQSIAMEDYKKLVVSPV